jgi:hypothetical protein
MSGLNITYPIKAGAVRGVIHLGADVTNDTDWHDLTSADFVDSVTGEAVPSGWKFSRIDVINLSTTETSFIKLRARSSAGDAILDEIPVLPLAGYGDDVATIRTAVTTIAYKKGEAGAAFYIIAGFDKE